MTGTFRRAPEHPRYFAEIRVPESFIEWAAMQLHARGHNLVDPQLIAFIFQEAIDTVFGDAGMEPGIETLFDRAIFNYELAMLFAQAMPDDSTRH